MSQVNLNNRLTSETDQSYPTPDELENQLIDDDIDLETNTEPNLEVTWYRWLVLFLYILCAVILSGISITLTPCSQLIADAYGVSLLQVSLTNLCYGITAIPMFFLSMKMFTVFSTAWTLRFATLLLVVGCWVR